MKCILVLLAMVAVAMAAIPTLNIYDNTFVEVDINKGTFYEFPMSIPATYYDDYYYLMLNVSLGVVTDQYHYAWLFVSTDPTNPTQTFMYEFTSSSLTYVVVDLSTYTCASGSCMLYIFINATCSDWSGCFDAVTTEMSVTLTNTWNYGWYQPLFSPMPGYGYNLDYPTIPATYTSVPYPTTAAWQYFYVAPTANLTTPVKIFPSAVAEAILYTLYGCQGTIPVNATNYCGGYPGWTQGRSGTEFFPPTAITTVAVNFGGFVAGKAGSSYQFGLTNAAAAYAVSAVALLASLLAHLL